MAADPARHAGGPGDRAARMHVHRLFEDHSRMVYALCRTLLRDEHDAEDATQATFVSAYKAILGGSEPREPAAWLATIARNECASRAHARMREPLPLADADADIAHTTGPETEFERRAAVAELRVAIEALPEKQREAVVLRDLYGLQYTEVGAALGISVASVESLLFRARRSLRVSLKPLATGALTVPLAVREGIAQAIPLFSETSVVAGGGAGGAVGVGLLAKLAAGPGGAKVAAGLVAALAAGSVAVAKVEQDRRPQSDPAPAASVPAANEAEGVLPAALVTGVVAGGKSASGRDGAGRTSRGAGGTDDDGSGAGGSGTSAGFAPVATTAPAASGSGSSGAESAAPGEGSSEPSGHGSGDSDSSGHASGKASGTSDDRLDDADAGKGSGDTLDAEDDHSGSGLPGSAGDSSDEDGSSSSGSGSGHDGSSGSGDHGGDETSESSHSGSGSGEDGDLPTAIASPL